MIPVALHSWQHLPDGALHKHVAHQPEALSGGIQRLERFDHKVVLCQLLLLVNLRARQLVTLIEQPVVVRVVEGCRT